MGEHEVLRSGVRDTDRDTPNSLFRIQKCARSVTIVHSGNRYNIGRTKQNHRGKHVKHIWGYYQNQWNLDLSSTPTKLVWKGGGFGNKVQIVWTKQTGARSSITMSNISSEVKQLPRKRNRSGNEHCACGDTTCNELQWKVGTVLQHKCTWLRPAGGRTMNDADIKKLEPRLQRKVVRAKATHQQILRWRSDGAVTKPVSRTARFNELHYPRCFLEAMKTAGKKNIPHKIKISEAKLLGMFCPRLVVGTDVVTVPQLSTKQVRETLPSSCSPTKRPLVTSPVSAPEADPTPPEAPTPCAAAVHSAYVKELQQVVNRVASEKARITKLFTSKCAEIAIIVKLVEAEMGPMDLAQKAAFWDGIRSNNPMENATDEPVVTELAGLIFPKSWGCMIKYNLTKADMTQKTCTVLYGFPVSFRELSWLITHVFFPEIEVKRTSMEFGTPLSNFEKALATLMLFKTGGTVQDVAHHWGVRSRRMGKYLQTWSGKWGQVALSLCRLDPPAELFSNMQPVGVNYPLPISHETAASSIKIGVSRKFSSKARSSYSNKIGTQSAHGLTWSSCIGLVILCTALFCARVSEKELVRLHSSWLHIFPPRHGRLVDHSFTFCTQWYKNLVRAFSPASVPCTTGGVTHRQVIDDRRQLADIYAGDKVYSRVKSFKMLTGRCPVQMIQYLNDAWYVAHMVANMFPPLVSPDCMDKWSDAKSNSASLRT